MIFISIAAYKDPVLLFTITDAVNKAKHPERLRFAVVEQNTTDGRDAIQALPFATQIRYVFVNERDTLGVCWARNLAFSLYNGERYLLQIDSHMLFEQDWDANLIAQYEKLRAISPKPIITTYPFSFVFKDNEPVAERHDLVTVLRPLTDSVLTTANKVLRFEGHPIKADGAVPGCHMAAGMFFCAGMFVEEVPYDPYLYFHGEEQSLSIRAFTNGWDIYHPRTLPVYHLYKQSGTYYESHHWSGATDGQRAFKSTELQDRAKHRLTLLLSGVKLPGSHGLGQRRTLEQFSKISGIDYLNNTINFRHGLPSN